MLLPTKYIPEEKSIVYLGGLLLSLFKNSTSISQLWDSYNKLQIKDNNNTVPFDLFIYAVDFLYLIDAIYYKNGHIYRSDNGDKKSI